MLVDQLQRPALPSEALRLDLSIVSQIAHWARTAPDSLALADVHQFLNFKQLHDRSDRLADRISSHGLVSDQVAVLFMDRSIDFVVCALAAMKAGAAYLPLDITTPLDRLASIFNDCDARLLLTHGGHARHLPVLRPHVLHVDTLDYSRFTDRMATEAAPYMPSPEDLAYVIYTSGSTGKPKGVEITQANLANLVAWHCEAFSLTPADRASQVAGLGFDAAGWEIWPALAAGASVHFADDRTRRSPQMLRDWLIAQEISVCFAPTLLAEQLIHMTWPADVPLRFLLTGADTLHRRPDVGLPFTLVNNYGPTECTVVATSGIVSADTSSDSFLPDTTTRTAPSIGTPIGDTIALVLDENLKQVAAGEAGELCLGGSLVGRGYRNDPAATAERFVRWSDGSRVLRIYRTGDRVRELPDGQFAFLGRLDQQVKIRGYRVELGEIAAALATHTGIAASTAILRDGRNATSSEPSESHLVGYVVLAMGAVLSADDLRAHLASRLPDYMIPAQFVKMTALPTTANGKLDKAALPAPTIDNVFTTRRTPAKAADPLSPLLPTARSPDIQKRICDLVAELLNEPSLQPDANFFMIGGHSMLGVQLVARIRDQFGVKLSLRQLFKAPTVAALSAEVIRIAQPN